MRLTIVHQIVFVGLIVTGMLLVLEAPFVGFDGKMPFALLAGGALALAWTGPILRWLSVWPLMPTCPRCGVWVQGFHRGVREEGLVLIAAPCGHLFQAEGEWVAPIFSDRTGLARRLILEMGWVRKEDGRVFRFGTDYPVVVLDEEGGTLGLRRSKWPYWVVRWTTE